MQIEIAGQKGRLWWEYHHNLTWEEIRDYGFERLLRLMPIEDTPLDSTDFTGTWIRWIPVGDCEDWDVEHSAVTICSATDKFIKEQGRKISLTRLLASMNLTKQQRKEVWNQYRNRRNH